MIGDLLCELVCGFSGFVICFALVMDCGLVVVCCWCCCGLGLLSLCDFCDFREFVCAGGLLRVLRLVLILVACSFWCGWFG